MSVKFLISASTTYLAYHVALDLEVILAAFGAFEIDLFDHGVFLYNDQPSPSNRQNIIDLQYVCIEHDCDVHIDKHHTSVW